MYKNLRRLAPLVAVLLMLALPLQTFAGRFLVGKVYDIGDAKSLPWVGQDWYSPQSNYDLNHLVSDTLALLTTETPVIVRMETLRRAVIYGEAGKVKREVNYVQRDDKVTALLFEKLMARVKAAESNGKADALALFDAGFFLESWRFCYEYEGKSLPALNGYEMVKKASALRNTDAAMELAAALIAGFGVDRVTFQQHLQKSIAGANDNAVLKRNLVKVIAGQGRSFEDVRVIAGL